MNEWMPSLLRHIGGKKLNSEVTRKKRLQEKGIWSWYN